MLGLLVLLGVSTYLFGLSEAPRTRTGIPQPEGGGKERRAVSFGDYFRMSRHTPGILDAFKNGELQGGLTALTPSFRRDPFSAD